MTPLEEKQLMLRVVLRLAKEQLEKGGFIPFGAALGMKRDVPRRMPKSMKKDVTPDKLDTYGNEQFRPIVAGQDCQTVCKCVPRRPAKQLTAFYSSHHPNIPEKKVSPTLVP